MQILVCNDDGVKSPILEALALMLKPYGEVLVIAPKENQSAKSHSIDIQEHFSSDLELEKIVSDIKFYSQPYQPVNSLLYCLEFTNFKPDLVISGINKGYNIGIDTFYSGTVGVAREATLRGIPSVAFSMKYDYDENDLKYLNQMLDYIMEHKLYNKDYSLNVNVPKGIDEFKFKLCSVDVVNVEGLTDTQVINSGFISLTPLNIQMTDINSLNILKKNFDI